MNHHLPATAPGARTLLLAFVLLALCVTATTPALAGRQDGVYADAFGNTLTLALVDAGIFVNISGETGEFQGPGQRIADRVYSVSDQQAEVMLLFLGDENLVLAPMNASLMADYGAFAGPYYRQDAVSDFIPPTFSYTSEAGSLVLEYLDEGAVTVTLDTPFCSFTAGGGLIGNHGIQLYSNFELAMTIYYAPEFAIALPLAPAICPGMSAQTFMLDPEATAQLRQQFPSASPDGTYRNDNGTVLVATQDDGHGSVLLETANCAYEGLLTMTTPHVAVTSAYGESTPLAAFLMGDGYLLISPLSDRFCERFVDFTTIFRKDGVPKQQFQEPGGDFANGQARASIFYSGEQLAQVSLTGQGCAYVGEGVVFLNHGLRIANSQGEVQAIMWYEDDALAIQRLDPEFCPQCTECDGLFTRLP